MKKLNNGDNKYCGVCPTRHKKRKNMPLFIIFSKRLICERSYLAGDSLFALVLMRAHIRYREDEIDIHQAHDSNHPL